MQLEELDALNAIFRQKKEKLSPRLQQKEFERLTVELAWKSSKIEGCSYNVLEVERLLKEGIAPQEKTAEETQMVMNHKKALDYVLEQPDYYKEITVAKIEEIHNLLTTGLGVEKGIRSGMVGIVGTSYRPLDNQFQIREALERLANLLNETKNTIERALIAVLMISYIQPLRMETSELRAFSATPYCWPMTTAPSPIEAWTKSSTRKVSSYSTNRTTSATSNSCS